VREEIAIIILGFIYHIGELGEIKMKTWISDNFPLKQLECQYFDICKDYAPNKCSYTSQCELRQWFKSVIEPYMARQNLEMQIELIKDEKR